MSDATEGGGQVSTRLSPREGFRHKFFNAIGWLAFALLLPPALKMLGLGQLQDMALAKLGSWGSPVALVIYFYVVLFLRIFFGSDQRYTPVLLGYGVSFLYFSNSLDIGFMHWLRELSARISFLSYPVISFITGIAVIFLANALSGARKAKWPLDLLFLVLLPAAALVCAGLFLPGLLGF